MYEGKLKNDFISEYIKIIRISGEHWMKKETTQLLLSNYNLVGECAASKLLLSFNMNDK